MKYGLPYQGSKNKLAERIVSLLPQAEHLIDVFCGGCAVSHAALLRGKYPHIHINDVDWRPVTLFQDALEGKYADEDRWISREDFFRLKDTDPYVAVVWSFANNMRDYLYSKEVEPLKRAIHYAMFYGDYEPGRELGHDFSFIDPIRDLQQRYLAIKRYFRNGAPQRQQSFEGGAELPCSTGECREVQLQSWNMGGAEYASYSVKRPSELQHFECRNRHTQITVQRATPLTTANGGGKNSLCLQPQWATTATCMCPTIVCSTLIHRIKAPVTTKSKVILTMRHSMTGARNRRCLYSSAVTICLQTVSVA